MSANADSIRSMDLERHLLGMMSRVLIEPRRLLLSTIGVRANTSMVRGVWGRALRTVDRTAYRIVFEGYTDHAQSTIPRYILRPAPPDPAYSPAIEWVLLGDLQEYGPALSRAWDVAGGMGLGPKCTPFLVMESRWLDSTGRETTSAVRWNLKEYAVSLQSRLSGCVPLRLQFTVPLRLLRRGRLIEQPTFADIAVTLTRRIWALADEPPMDGRAVVRAVAASAKQLSATLWQGERATYVRWSGAQHREVHLYGVVGSMDLPTGAGALWPLLAAAPWIHLGKGTVFGLGLMEAVPI